MPPTTRSDGSANTAANVLRGGLGNDLHRLGVGDTVFETPGEGFDTVEFNHRPTSGVISIATAGASSIERFGIAEEAGGYLTLTGSAGADDLYYDGVTYEAFGWTPAERCRAWAETTRLPVASGTTDSTAVRGRM